MQVMVHNNIIMYVWVAGARNQVSPFLHSTEKVFKNLLIVPLHGILISNLTTLLKMSKVIL